MTEPRPLTRVVAGTNAPAPIRMVHIGLGAFHRSHQAWYTAAVDSEHEWGIAAFTGRSPEAADRLAAQDGLYTLIERDDAGDRFQIVDSISAAHHGGNTEELVRLVAAPTTSIITLTITEPAYYLRTDGKLDTDAPAVAKDLAALKLWQQAQAQAQSDAGPDEIAVPSPLITAGARLTAALDCRRRAGSGPLAVISCDNLSANGSAARETILGFARRISEDLAQWIEVSVCFVDSSIDRITPRTTEADIEIVVRETGFDDQTPVVTEPFHNWVLSGSFPAGRPDWEKAGATFTDHIEPFEQRKLWLLNGAHSLLAYAGQLRGHHTVSEAVEDQQCRAWLEEFWAEAAHHLTDPALKVTAYQAALLQRFSNSRIRHQLPQIAAEGSSKLRMRAVPVLLAERADRRSGAASARIIGAWIDQILADRAQGVPLLDFAAEDIDRILQGNPDEITRDLVRLLDEGLGDDVVTLIDTFRNTWHA